MRYRQKKKREQSTWTVLRRALAIVSKVVTIIGAIVGIIDMLHRW
jgi:hypothetical protein